MKLVVSTICSLYVFGPVVDDCPAQLHYVGLYMFFVKVKDFSRMKLGLYRCLEFVLTGLAEGRLGQTFAEVELEFESLVGTVFS